MTQPLDPFLPRNYSGGSNLFTDGDHVVSTLTVSEVERLAKAGVKVEFKDIAAQVRPDIPESPHLFDNRLVKPLVERRAASRCNSQDNFISFPFNAYVTRYGDKFYIFLSTGCHEPCILQDEAHLYPSDALMASIHLLLSTPGVYKPETYNGEGSQSGSAANPGTIGLAGSTPDTRSRFR